MTKTRKLLIGLGVTAALLVPAGAVYAATDDSGANGANGRPASGMMAGDMQRDRQHAQDCTGDQLKTRDRAHPGQQVGANAGQHAGAQQHDGNRNGPANT